jgi:hypothetical protein
VEEWGGQDGLAVEDAGDVPRLPSGRLIVGRVDHPDLALPTEGYSHPYTRNDLVDPLGRNAINEGLVDRLR